MVIIFAALRLPRLRSILLFLRLITGFDIDVANTSLTIFPPMFTPLIVTLVAIAPSLSMMLFTPRLPRFVAGALPLSIRR